MEVERAQNQPSPEAIMDLGIKQEAAELESSDDEDLAACFKKVDNVIAHGRCMSISSAFSGPTLNEALKSEPTYDSSIVKKEFVEKGSPGESIAKSEKQIRHEIKKRKKRKREREQRRLIENLQREVNDLKQQDADNTKTIAKLIETLQQGSSSVNREMESASIDAQVKSETHHYTNPTDEVRDLSTAIGHPRQEQQTTLPSSCTSPSSSPPPPKLAKASSETANLREFHDKCSREGACAYPINFVCPTCPQYGLRICHIHKDGSKVDAALPHEVLHLPRSMYAKVFPLLDDRGRPLCKKGIYPYRDSKISIDLGGAPPSEMGTAIATCQLMCSPLKKFSECNRGYFGLLKARPGTLTLPWPGKNVGVRLLLSKQFASDDPIVLVPDDERISVTSGPFKVPERRTDPINVALGLPVTMSLGSARIGRVYHAMDPDLFDLSPAVIASQFPLTVAEKERLEGENNSTVKGN